MAAKTEESRRRQPEGFDVVCRIGRVEFGGGDVNPYVAAFLLIGEHGADGSYEFPGANGRPVNVTVSGNYADDGETEEIR